MRSTRGSSTLLPKPEYALARNSPQTTTLSKASVGGPWVLVVAIAGSAMVFIDGTAVNVALPSLQRDLNADAASLQWVVEGYSLVLSAFILIGGALGDRFGRRRAFLGGIALFAVASLLCALSQNMLELNLARCSARSRWRLRDARQPGADQRELPGGGPRERRSERGPGSRPSPPRSGPCWAVG